MSVRTVAKCNDGLTLTVGTGPLYTTQSVEQRHHSLAAPPPPHRPPSARARDRGPNIGVPSASGRPYPRPPWVVAAMSLAFRSPRPFAPSVRATARPFTSGQLPLATRAHRAKVARVRAGDCSTDACSEPQCVANVSESVPAYPPAATRAQLACISAIGSSYSASHGYGLSGQLLLVTHSHAPSPRATPAAVSKIPAHAAFDQETYEQRRSTGAWVFGSAALAEYLCQLRWHIP